MRDAVGWADELELCLNLDISEMKWRLKDFEIISSFKFLFLASSQSSL
jgi:hypothetical protein